jgi:hypothetical protein
MASQGGDSSSAQVILNEVALEQFFSEFVDFLLSLSSFNQRSILIYHSSCSSTIVLTKRHITSLALGWSQSTGIFISNYYEFVPSKYAERKYVILQHY